MRKDFDKIKKCNQCMEIMKDIEYILNDATGEGSCIVSLDEGNEKDTNSLIIADVVSFTTFSPLVLKAFREALSLCDAINLFNAGDYVRITLAFKNTHIRERETEVLQFKK